MQTHGLYLNGKWVNSDQTITVTNPATEQPIARVATVDRKGVAKALDDAKSAMSAWQNLTAKDRGDYLLAIAEQLGQRSDEIARLITLENGKPLAQSKGEVAMTIDHFRWFAEQGRRAYGRIVPHQAQGRRHWVIRSPVGVVGAIAPWNFPLVLAVRKVAPAMAAGCAVLLKPASATPLSSVALAKCIEAAGVPAGVFQLILGSASDIGRELLQNPICRKISFTGSTEVGKQLIAGAAETVTRLSLELGGNAPLLVFDDADVDQAVEGAMIAKFRNTGQSCIAANPMYIQSGIHDRFVERFVEVTRALKVGDGLEEGVDIGALIDEPALKDALGLIEDAQSKGAEVLCGGKRVGTSGFFLEPTVMVNVSVDACCMNREIFAPVASISQFDTESQAIQRANDTEFGLAAYVFTRDLNRAIRLSESLEAGTIGINEGTPATSNCPFCGIKQSGWGRELGEEGLDAYLETKHISIGEVGR